MDDQESLENAKPIKTEFISHIPLSFNRKNEKRIILNMPNQKYDQKLGKIKYNAEIDPGEVQFKQQNQNRRKQATKRQFPTLKCSFRGSKNPKKLFSFSLPYGRNTRKTNDTKIHFLLELTMQDGLLSVVEDYCDTTFDIIDPKAKQKPKQSLQEAVKKQKQLLDARRANTNDFRDPDFQGGEQESD